MDKLPKCTQKNGQHHTNDQGNVNQNYGEIPLHQDDYNEKMIK